MKKKDFASLNLLEIAKLILEAHERYREENGDSASSLGESAYDSESEKRKKTKEIKKNQRNQKNQNLDKRK